jgi:hypothetical protein
MTTRLIAALVTSVLATSLVLPPSAQAGGCGGGGYKAYRSSSKADAYSKKKTIVSTERRSELPAGAPVVDKSVEPEITATAEELAKPVDKAAELPNSETEARTTGAAGSKDCKRFAAAIGSTVSVECAK